MYWFLDMRMELYDYLCKDLRSKSADNANKSSFFHKFTFFKRNAILYLDNNLFSLKFSNFKF